MKVRYVRSSEPDKEKVLDSTVLRKTDAMFGKIFFKQDDPRTQEEYDTYLLRKLENDKNEGIILRYEIIKEE